MAKNKFGKTNSGGNQLMQDINGQDFEWVNYLRPIKDCRFL